MTLRINIFYDLMVPGTCISGGLNFLGFAYTNLAYVVVKLTVIMVAHSAAH